MAARTGARTGLSPPALASDSGVLNHSATEGTILTVKPNPGAIGHDCPLGNGRQQANKCSPARPLNIAQTVQFFAWSLTLGYGTGAAFWSETFPTFWFWASLMDMDSCWEVTSMVYTDIVTFPTSTEVIRGQ